MSMAQSITRRVAQDIFRLGISRNSHESQSSQKQNGADDSPLAHIGRLLRFHIDLTKAFFTIRSRLAFGHIHFHITLRNSYIPFLLSPKSQYIRIAHLSTNFRFQMERPLQQRNVETFMNSMRRQQKQINRQDHVKQACR